MFKKKSHNFQWFNLRNYDIHQANPFLTPRKTMKTSLIGVNKSEGFHHSFWNPAWFMTWGILTYERISPKTNKTAANFCIALPYTVYK